MSGTLRIVGLLLICLVLCTVQGCDNDDDNWGQVGMVEYSDLGCWVIVEGAGQGIMRHLEPTNLEDRFKVNGLWVRFEYVIPEEGFTVCNAGPVITLTRIEGL